MRHATWLLVLCSSSLLIAQQPKTFRTRLAPVLTGTKLAITGTFEGLRSPATIAQLHRSPVKGVCGPVVFDLAVKADGTSGTLSGTLELTPIQVADLEKGRLYVQLHSEKAPDGNLWGWLTPQENRR